MQRWRDKVYECLLANKRNEVTIKENLREHKKERAAVETVLKQSQAEVLVLKTKQTQMELERAEERSRVQALEAENAALASEKQGFLRERQVLLEIVTSAQHTMNKQCSAMEDSARSVSALNLRCNNLAQSLSLAYA